MDFKLTEDQQAFQKTARDFAQSELPEAAQICETEASPPTHELIRKYGEMGFLGINVPEEYGGLGLGNIDALIVLEEFAKFLQPLRFPF